MSEMKLYEVKHIFAEYDSLKNIYYYYFFSCGFVTPVLTGGF